MAAAPALMAGGMAMNIGTAYQQSTLEKSAGRIQAREAEIVAKQEELGAIQREADRKFRLSEALSTQIASSGAGGVAAFEGSPLTVIEASIKEEATASERDEYMTKLSAMSARAKGQMAKRMGKIRGGMTLMSGLGQAGVSGATYANIK